VCKNADICSELGSDPASWSTCAPLPPPEWFRDQLRPLKSAFNAAAVGDIEGARKSLAGMRRQDLQVWYDLHGQNSGKYRAKHFLVTVPPRVQPEPKRWKPNVGMQDTLLYRDHFRCRYCGIPVISERILDLFQKLVGVNYFKAKGRSNIERHGAVMAFRANFDHVIPRTLGGSDNEGNLVVACWSCNYGKWNYTLAQLGITDPRERPAAAIDNWDGLSSLVSGLKTTLRRVKII